LVEEQRLVTVAASDIGDRYEWWPIAERLAALVGEPLFADGVPRRRIRRQAPAAADPAPKSQLPLDYEA
jgi:hypothetical protein